MKAIVNDFGRHGKPARDFIIPQVLYYTNDAWEIVSAGRPLSGGVTGYPIILRAPYSQGNLYVLTIPDDMGNLYDYPDGALNEIRRILSKDMDVYMEGPSKVGLFMYDNRTFVVENFNDQPVEIRIITEPGKTDALKSLLDNETILSSPKEQPAFSWGRPADPKDSFRITLTPHSYKAFKY